jgi:hypothetical protein
MRAGATKGWPVAATAIAIATTVLVGLPIAGIVLVTAWDSTNSLTPDVQLTAPVVDAGVDFVEPVDLALTWSPVPAVFAPQWSGIVTAVPPRAPEIWSSGDLIVEIDRVGRIAYASSAPFTRALQSGDRGADVADLNALLRSRSYPADAGDRFTAATLRGVRLLATELGASPSATSFDPSWLVFLPRPTMTVSGAALQLGATAPTPGSELIAAGVELSGAALMRPGLFGELQSNQAPPQDSRAINIDDASRVVAPEGAQLTLDGLPLALAGDAASVDAEGLVALSLKVTSGAAFVAAKLATESDQPMYRIPAAAIFADGSALCVIAVPDKHPVEVKVISSDGPATTVVGELNAGEQVLVAPPSDARSCN